MEAEHTRIPEKQITIGCAEHSALAARHGIGCRISRTERDLQSLLYLSKSRHARQDACAQYFSQLNLITSLPQDVQPVTR